ncbi:MAG: hypothetical protein ACHBN1_35865 [Heteroscytonema crispum UTEX LB 1556]
MQINKSGVVLRGSGDGKNPDKDTILITKVVDKPVVDKPNKIVRGDSSELQRQKNRKETSARLFGKPVAAQEPDKSGY